MRHIQSWRAASFVLCLAVSTAACGSVASGEAGAPSVAAPARAVAGMTASIGVGETRVVSARVNMRERVHVDALGGAIVISFAERGREGRVITLDPSTLEVRSTAPLSIPAHAPYAVLPYREARSTVATLRSGGALKAWTAGGAGAVYVQPADATVAQAALEVSPRGAFVMGDPQVASVDGRRVVLVYFMSSDEGFCLAATALDVETPGALRLSEAP